MSRTRRPGSSARARNRGDHAMSDDAVTSVLTPKQYNAIAALLNTFTVRQAAQECGVTERTLFRWLKDPLFVEEYRAARRQAVQQAIARSQQVSGHAVSVLVSLMASSTPAVKLGAARTILELSIKAVELEDLE